MFSPCLTMHKLCKFLNIMKIFPRGNPRIWHSKERNASRLLSFGWTVYVLRKRLKKQVLQEIVLLINDENIPTFPCNLYLRNQKFSPNRIWRKNRDTFVRTRFYAQWRRQLHDFTDVEAAIFESLPFPPLPLPPLGDAIFA